MAKFRDDFLKSYLAAAPLALALERVLECKILSEQEFAQPVLDLGCGDGMFGTILFAEKIDTGIDYDPKEIERAKKTGIYKKLICCSGNSIPEYEASYGTIFSNSVLEHIPEVGPVLREAYRLLKPGGYFYFTVPSETFDRYSVGNLLLEKCGLGKKATDFRAFYNKFWKHYHAYPPEGWSKLATDAGFHVEEARRYNPPKIATLNDALAPFAVTSSLTQRILGKWVLCPDLRRHLFRPMVPLFRRWLASSNGLEKGCLVFVKAVKPLNPTP